MITLFADLHYVAFLSNQLTMPKTQQAQRSLLFPTSPSAIYMMLYNMRRQGSNNGLFRNGFNLPQLACQIEQQAREITQPNSGGALYLISENPRTYMRVTASQRNYIVYLRSGYEAPVQFSI